MSFVKPKPKHRIWSNKRPGAYFRFRVQGGRLIEEGQLFEERRLLTNLQRLIICFYDFITQKKTDFKGGSFLIYVVVSTFIIIDNLHLAVGHLPVGQSDILKMIFPFFIYFKTVGPCKIFLPVS